MPQSTKPNLLTAWVAVLMSAVLTLEGCSVAIAIKDRIGPNPEQNFDKGASRAEVERDLGEPIAIESLADGNVRVVYEYTARVRKEYTNPPRPDLGLAAMLLMLEVASYGLIELVFMPIAYFSKTKYTYQKAYVFTPDGTIVESSRECIQHHATKNAADWCSQPNVEQAVAEQVTPAQEDKPATPSPGPEP